MGHIYVKTETNWVVIYVKNNDITYFGIFGIEYFPKEIIGDIDLKANIFRIQTYDSC